MKKSWFYRLLLSYLPIFLAIVSVLIFIFFFAISEIAKKRVQEANDVLARQIMQNIDYSLQTIEQMTIKEVTNDESVKSFMMMNSSDNVYWLNRELSLRLAEIMGNYPLIDSIYVYRAADRTLLSPAAFMSVNQAGDKLFIEDMAGTSIMKRWTGIRSYAVDADAEPKQVVSLVRKIPTLLDRGFIVINVSTNAFRDIINAMSSPQIHEIILLDSNAQLLSHNDSIGSDDEDFSEIAEVAKVQSDYTGWEIRSGINDSPMFSFLSILSSFWIVAGFGTVIAGGLLMIYMTRLNYRPIESIIDRIHKYPLSPVSQLPVDDRNEFKLIESALDNLVDQTDQYRKQQKEDHVFKRKYLFEELLAGSMIFEGKQLNKEIQTLGIHADFNQVAVVVFEVDKHYELARHYTPKDLQLFRYVVESVITEIAQKHSQAVWCEWIANHRLSALWMVKAERQDALDFVCRICEDVRDWVEHNLKFTISAGIGTVEDMTENISQSYEAATEALKYKLSLGSNQVILFSAIGELPKGEYFQHLQLIRSLAQKFRLGEAVWESELYGLFELLKNQYLPRNEVANLMNYLMYHLYLEMQEMPSDIQAFWKHETLPCFNQLTERFESVDDLEKETYDLLQTAYNHIKQIREGRHNYKLIHDVKMYIETEFANQNLSLISLSEEFKLNANYLSRLFKEEFGVKFVDYLSTVRIEQAKQMLAQSSMPIQEIANIVGYTHSFSFIRAFKKQTGFTPGDYRKELDNP
jgi:two-component system response regulator YesN